MTNELYNEISEDLRQQELEKFWKENRAWIAGGIVAAVLMTAGMSWWREYKVERDTAATAAMAAAVETADPAKIETYAKDANTDHAMLAKFAEARLYAERKEAAKAAAVYDEIAGMSRADKTWRDLARLYSVQQRLDAGEPGKLHEDLAALSGKTAPFRYSAEEMSGLLYAREKNFTKAREIFSKLADDSEAPRNVRARAANLRDLYAAGGDGNG
jgi:hypothetical protein